MGSGTLDRTDFEILRILQKNAWTPNKQIADTVGLAPSSCHERIRHLRASGVIRGAHAQLEPRAIEGLDAARGIDGGARVHQARQVPEIGH